MVEFQNVLILASVWPEPTSSAAGVRMMELINLFLDQKWRVTFGTAAAESTYCADLQMLNVDKVKVELNNSGFDSYIRDLNPTIVVFDRFMVEEQFGWRVAEQCPEALRILNTEDLHCLRSARFKAFKASREFTANDLLSNDASKREIASIFRCDLALIISRFEVKLLKDLFKIDEDLLHYLPFMTDTIDENVTSRWPRFSERQHFVTIGNFLHQPNCDSVEMLKKDIWPLVREALPKAELHIYGAYPVPRITQLSNPKEGFLVKGRAEDSLKMMSYSRVCLAPLRFGAGLKGKLFDAMLSGTPSVTTSIGAEAMHDDLEWNGYISDDPGEISRRAVELYTDESSWIKAQKNGIQIVNKCFLKDLFQKKLLNRITAIQNSLLIHRGKNFTGSMLMHHTMASTKFMSRWIEAKNINNNSL
ncbi:glycosyltransferase [Flavihumibacter sp. R14]|nr:glycosyltransferase [Flavihumibacter soli]